jgi:hypothetical protein
MEILHPYPRWEKINLAAMFFTLACMKAIFTLVIYYTGIKVAITEEMINIKFSSINSKNTSRHSRLLKIKFLQVFHWKYYQNFKKISYLDNVL